MLGADPRRSPPAGRSPPLRHRTWTDESSPPPSVAWPGGGVSKTTLDDVARQARCSRATVYRLFPGGKEALLQAVARCEVARVGTAVGRRLERAATLADALTAALAEAARQVAYACFAFPILLAHEPEAVVPWLAFQRGRGAAGLCHRPAAPRLARFLAPRGGAAGRGMGRPGPAAPCPVPAAGRRPHRRKSARSVRHHLPAPGPGPGTDRGNFMAIDYRTIAATTDRLILELTNTDVDEVIHPVEADYDTIFTWDYEKGARPKLTGSTRRPRGRVERPRPTCPGTRRSTRSGSSWPTPRPLGGFDRGVDLAGTAFANWNDAEWVQLRRREPELDAVAVHARRAGRAALHGQDRRDRAVDRRQVLRRHPGDGRGPPRRGVLQVPRHQAVGPLPDERPPAGCCSTTSSPTPAGT